MTRILSSHLKMEGRKWISQGFFPNKKKQCFKIEEEEDFHINVNIYVELLRIIG